MTNEDFNRVVEKQLDYCIELLGVKNTEYKGEANRFHTFDVAAKLQGCTRKQALAGMMAKHSVSVYDMCASGEYSLEKWTEKITDSINYLLLLRAMIAEDKEGKEDYHA